MLTVCFIHGCTSSNNCIGYKQINKDNIRNCLEANQKPLNVVPEKAVKDVDSEVVLYDLKTSEFSLARKMKMSMNTLQYLLVAGFLMAGILPWIMPGLQMAVSVLSMINNMAFTSALVALIRSYVFDKEPDEHVVYINHGYKHKKQTRWFLKFGFVNVYLNMFF